MAKSEAARKAYNEYHRKYRAEHKAEIKRNIDKYWERKGAELLEREKGNDEPVTD